MQMSMTCSRPLPEPCYGKYYVYSSGPALSHADRSKKPRPEPKKSRSWISNHATLIRTRGAHEFYNMMWDPSIYRGNTTKPYFEYEMDRCNKKRKEMDPSIKRRKFPRKQKLVGGIVRPSLSLSDQTEKFGFDDMGMQTEQFLEEMTSEVAKKDMCTQVEGEVNARKEMPGYVLRPFMTGTSQGIQTDRALSFPFGQNVLPVQKQLSTKILEQSLLETTEEMEIESIRIEKRKLIQLRAEETYRLKRAVEAKCIVTEERNRMMNIKAHEATAEEEAESRLGATLFSAGCMGGLLPITFGVLKLEGYMPDTGASEIYENLVPWMNKSTRKSYEGRRIVSRKLLDELLHNVTIEREAEFARNQFWNSSKSTKHRDSQNFSITEDELLGSSSDPSHEIQKAKHYASMLHHGKYDYGHE